MATMLIPEVREGRELDFEGGSQLDKRVQDECSRYCARTPERKRSLGWRWILAWDCPQESGPIERACDEAGLGRWITFPLPIEPVGGENLSIRQLNRAGISQVMSSSINAENDLVLDIPSLAAVLADRCTHSVRLSPVAIRAEDATVA